MRMMMSLVRRGGAAIVVLVIGVITSVIGQIEWEDDPSHDG